MTTSRPGFIYSGTEWVPIGAQASETPIKVQSTEPSSPQTGDLWVDTSVISPSIDPTTLATKDELSSVEAIAMLGL
jgi:hypothetical protein